MAFLMLVLRKILLVAMLLTCCAVSRHSFATCPPLPAPTSPGPGVILVSGDGDPSRYGVLFLGDGFEAGDLNDYRIAVQDLVYGLSFVAPFNTYFDRFNFYRMDVVDSTQTGFIPNTLANPTGCPTNFDVESLNTVQLVQYFSPAPIPPSAGLPHLADLGAVFCFNGSDKVVFTNSTCDILALEMFAPTNIDTFVLIADSKLHAGGARIEVDAPETTVIVLTLPLEPAVTGAFRLSSAAIRLFAHEFGHGLGLHDEYTSALGIVPTEPRPCRNIWHPDPTMPPTWNPVTKNGGWPAGVTPEIPWFCKLKKGCTPQDMSQCYGAGQPCVLDGINLCAAECSFVPFTAPSYAAPCGPVRACDTLAGAWEGAFYQQHHYYRARSECVMTTLGETVKFCDGCLDYLAHRLCPYSATSCDCSSFEARCDPPVDCIDASEEWCEETYGSTTDPDEVVEMNFAFLDEERLTTSRNAVAELPRNPHWFSGQVTKRRWLPDPPPPDLREVKRNRRPINPREPKTCLIPVELAGAKVVAMDYEPVGESRRPAQSVLIANDMHILRIERRESRLEWYLTETGTGASCQLQPSGSIADGLPVEILRLGSRNVRMQETRDKKDAAALYIKMQRPEKAFDRPAPD